MAPLPHLRRVSVVCPRRSRRPSVTRRNKPYFGFVTAGRRGPDGQTTLARGCATDALRPSVHRVSVALPSRIVVCPLRSHRPSVISPKSASSKRLCIVGVSSQCGQVVVFVAVVVVASSSHARRAVVALSSHRRRIVVASSSHRRGAVVPTSSCCHLLAVKTPPLILETIPHMSSELR